MTSTDYKLIAMGLDTFVSTYASEPDPLMLQRAKELALHYWSLAQEAEERIAKLPRFSSST